MIVPSAKALAERLARLHAEAFAPERRAWSASELHALATTPGALLAVDDVDAPRGFALARVAADEAELLTIAVSPSRRRRGLGTALLSEIEGHAARRGARAVFLEVSCDALAARSLYRCSNYSEIGFRPGYYGPTPSGDALALKKTLRR